ncbi:hypothetical protein [Thauera humireducens]|uniref:hypothetical protein n=1 Tax=Thauera humireducens TaxID=1134435 RepID=UPI00311E3C1E
MEHWLVTGESSNLPYRQGAEPQSWEKLSCVSQQVAPVAHRPLDTLRDNSALLAYVLFGHHAANLDRLPEFVIDAKETLIYSSATTGLAACL